MTKKEKNPVIEQVAFDIVQIGVAEMVSKKFRDTMKLGVTEMAGKNILLNLKAYLVGNTIHREVRKIGEYPINIWNHLLWSMSFTKKYAKTKQIDEEILFTHVCPHLNYPEDDNRVHINFLRKP